MNWAKFAFCKYVVMVESPDGSYDSAKRKKKTVRRPILSATVNHLNLRLDLSTLPKNLNLKLILNALKILKSEILKQSGERVVKIGTLITCIQYFVIIKSRFINYFYNKTIN